MNKSTTEKYEYYYNLLLRSFDETLGTKEQAELQAALATSTELQNEKAAYEQLHQLLAIQKKEADIPFFAANVMHQIRELENPKTTPLTTNLNNILKAFFPKMVFSTLTVFGIFILSIYFLEGHVSIDSILGISEFASDESLSEYLITSDI